MDAVDCRCLCRLPPSLKLLCACQCTLGTGGPAASTGRAAVEGQQDADTAESQQRVTELVWP